MMKSFKISWVLRTSQWLRLRAAAAGGTGSSPGLGTKMPHDPKIKNIWMML